MVVVDKDGYISSKTIIIVIIIIIIFYYKWNPYRL
jgi:hypothetical protein